MENPQGRRRCFRLNYLRLLEAAGCDKEVVPWYQRGGRRLTETPGIRVAAGQTQGDTYSNG